MKKLWLIAWAEFNFHVRQASFFIALALMILLAVLLSWLPTGNRDELALGLDSFTAVRESFSLGEGMMASELVGFVDLADIVVQEPTEWEENLRQYESEAQAAAALQAGDIRHYYVIEEGYIDHGRVRHYSTVNASLNMADATIEQFLRRNIRAQTYTQRLEMPSVLDVVWVDQPNPMLSRLSADLEWGAIFTSIVVLGLFAYLVNISGALLLDALMRESSARIMEMMVTMTTPAQFLGGKVLGLTLVAGLQLGVSLGAGYMVYDTAVAPLTGITPTIILLIAAFLGLGYLAYSGLVMMMTMLFPHIGTSLQLQFFLRMLILSPAIGIFFILPNLNGWLSVALTLNPLSSALLMPLRMLFTAVAPTQIMLSLLLLLAWSLLIFWLSTRLFRAQTMLTGRRPSARAVWQALWA